MFLSISSNGDESHPISIRLGSRVEPALTQKVYEQRLVDVEAMYVNMQDIPDRVDGLMNAGSGDRLSFQSTIIMYMCIVYATNPNNGNRRTGFDFNAPSRLKYPVPTDIRRPSPIPPSAA
jgi:hypothetical protein